MRCSPHEGRCCHKLMRAPHFSRTETICRVKAARLAVDFRREHRQRDCSNLACKLGTECRLRVKPGSGGVSKSCLLYTLKADIDCRKCDVRLVPTGDMVGLLVSASEHR